MREKWLRVPLLGLPGVSLAEETPSLQVPFHHTNGHRSLGLLPQALLFSLGVAFPLALSWGLLLLTLCFPFQLSCVTANFFQKGYFLSGIFMAAWPGGHGALEQRLALCQQHAGSEVMPSDVSPFLQPSGAGEKLVRHIQLADNGTPFLSRLTLA